jgi:hypothetical protein
MSKPFVKLSNLYDFPSDVIAIFFICYSIYTTSNHSVLQVGHTSWLHAIPGGVVW